MTSINFIYLDAGSRKAPHLLQSEVGIEIEIQYSISTLKFDMSSDCRIIIYTDNPERYRSLSAEVIDLSTIYPPYYDESRYVYLLKPYIVLHALRRFGNACVFLDSDTYIHQGFSQAIKNLIEDGPVLWDVEFVEPRSHFPEDIPPYPHHSAHKPWPGGRPQGNSGVIGLKAGWGEAIMEDAIHLIRTMWARGDHAVTLEQSSVFEAVWLSGRKALDCKPWLEHYCTSSKKRYMHWQIKKLLKRHGRPLPAVEPTIKLTLARVKLYQYYWDVKRSFMSARQAFSRQLR
jgi:hypothetical protein